jgi:hypothetical protein
MHLPSTAALALLLLAVPALAQDTDPADIAFWQSIQGSTNPAEYQAYLNAFPNGRFAPVARLRAGGGGDPAEGAQPAAQGGGKPAALGGPDAAPGANNAPVPRPGPAPAPAPAPMPADDTPDEASSGTITATPAIARVGNQITLSFKDFPKATSYDVIVVVPAGTPDLDPMQRGGDMKILDRTYASNLMDGSGNETTWKVGPHAPGRYEARWMTRLYNNEDRLEVKARAPLTWR